MNIFKRKNNTNIYNIGDIFKMDVELIEIKKSGESIIYSFRPCFKGASGIYGLTIDNLKEMEIK